MYGRPGRPSLSVSEGRGGKSGDLLSLRIEPISSPEEGRAETWLMTTHIDTFLQLFSKKAWMPVFGAPLLLDSM